MKDRIRQIMEDQHLTQQSFANLIGISTASLSSIFNDRTKPTLNIVDAIKKKFPTVSLEWLLYGTLPMYVTSSSEASEGSEEDTTSPDAAYPIGSEPTLDFEESSNVHPEQLQTHSVNRTPKNIVQTEVKYIDKQPRKITEIRIFYDDQTWETFVPKK